MKKKAYNTFHIRPYVHVGVLHGFVTNKNEVEIHDCQGEDADILTMTDVTRIRENIHATRVKKHKLP